MAVIKTIEDLYKYLPFLVGSNTSWNLVEADIESASNIVKRDIIGFTLYPELSSDPNVIELIKPFEAYAAAVRFIPQLDLVLTASGFAVMSNNNQAPASKSRVEALLESCQKNCNDAILDLLHHMQANVDWSKWVGTRYACIAPSTPTPTIQLFRQFAPNWNGDLFDFIKLFPRMREVAIGRFLPYLGQAFFNTLLLATADDSNASPQIVYLLPHLQFSFANYILGNEEAGRKFFQNMKTVLLNDLDSFPEFNAHIGDIHEGEWQNSTDNKIVVFGG